MKSYLEFVDEFRTSDLFDGLVPQEYKEEMEKLAEEITSSEENLLKTLNEEQLEKYNELDDCIYRYVEVLERNLFFKGFELSKKLSES